jgi:hypothetical protein
MPFVGNNVRASSARILRTKCTLTVNYVYVHVDDQFQLSAVSYTD